MTRLQAEEQENRCSSLSSFGDSSVRHYVHVRPLSHPVRISLIPRCVSARYKGRKMKPITHLRFVPKAMKQRRHTSTRSLLVGVCFGSSCLFTLVVLEIQSAIRFKSTVLTNMLELLCFVLGWRFFINEEESNDHHSPYSVLRE